jgi:hypothetical protein
MQVIIPIENTIIVQAQFNPQTPSQGDENILITVGPGNTVSPHSGMVLNMPESTAKALVQALNQAIQWRSYRSSNSGGTT